MGLGPSLLLHHLWTVGIVSKWVARGEWIFTYRDNGQGESHCVQHCGGDGAVVERVADAVVLTEKAPLVGADLTEFKDG